MHWKNNFIKQERANDCGLACLANLIFYFQKQTITLEKLRAQCPKVETQNLSFFDLIQLGAKYYLKGTGYQCELTFLLAQVRFGPLILQVTNHLGNNHYWLLLEGNAQWAFISDPAHSENVQKISWKTLEKSYLGAILVFRRTKKWTPQNNTQFLKFYLVQESVQLWKIVSSLILAALFNFLGANFILIFWQCLQTATFEPGLFLNYLGLGLSAKLFEKMSHYFTLDLSQRTLKNLWNWSLNYFEVHDWQVQNQKILKAQTNLEAYAWLIIRLVCFLSWGPLIIIWLAQANEFLLFSLLFFLIITGFSQWWWLKCGRVAERRENLLTKNYQNEFKNLNYLWKHFKKRYLHQLPSLDFLKAQNQALRAERQVWFFNTGHKLLLRFYLKIIYYLFLFLVTQIWTLPSNLTFNIFHCLNLIMLSFYLMTTFLKSFFTCQQQSLLNPLESDFTEPKKQLIPQKIPCQNFGWKEVIWPANSLLPDHFSKENSFVLCLNPAELNTFFQQLFSPQNQNRFFYNGFNWDPMKIRHFYLAENEPLLPNLVINNLFYNQIIPQQMIQEIDFRFWLQRYQLDFDAPITPNLTKAQQQLINFLSLFNSQEEFYLLNQPLSALPFDDQKKLWELFLKIKGQSYTILGTNSPEFAALCSQKTPKRGVI